MTKYVTLDQLATFALLRRDDSELKRLYRITQSMIGELCPACDAETIEHGVGGVFRCVSCNHQWGDE